MPARPCPVPPSTRALGPSDLDRLVTVLAEASAGAPPAIVRARRGPRLVDLGIADIPPGLDPVAALVGIVVPPGWDVSGLVTPVTVTLPDGARRSAVAAVAVGRDGTVASAVQGDEPGIPPLDEPPEGTVVDLLRRSLRVATPAPTTAPATFWTTLWLDGVVARALGCHPSDAVDTSAGSGAGPGSAGAAVVSAELVDALAAVPEIDVPSGWGWLRQLVAGPEGSSGPGAELHREAAVVRRSLAALVTPAEAAWHDDGSFARCLERALPPVSELLAIADSACDASLARQLRAVACSPTPPWPTVPEPGRERR